MKQISYILLVIMTAWVVTSCCEETPPNQEEMLNASNSRIYELISNYANARVAPTRSKTTFTITNIARQKYEIDQFVEDSTLTRSGLCNAEPFEIQTVSLDFGDKEGYAIVSDDSRLNHVFFYTESGHISDTTFIKPLKEIVEEYPQIASDIIVLNQEEQTRADGGIIPIVNPITRFEWDQKPPFNNYAPYCTCISCRAIGNHMPIGCVTTAVAQTIATIGKFKGTFYGTKDINFKSLPKYGNSFYGTQKEQIAHFFHEIALNCQVKFGCSSSVTQAVAAYNYLIDLGYNCTLAKGAIDSAKIIQNLKKGYPQLAAGSDSDGGHMWTIDGIQVQNSRYDYYCNWGWGYGRSNGWSTGNHYTTQDGKDSFPKNTQYIYVN